MKAMSHVWRGFRRLTKVDDARRKFIGALSLKPTEPEVVGIDEALGRVLAVDVIAPQDVPPKPRAAMDGYAVRSRDTLGASWDSPVTLKLVGEVPAGKVTGLKIGKMEAARIFTGAYLPDGADAVIPVEEAEEVAGSVEIYTQVPAWKNVARPGEDVEKGAVVLRAGTPLGPYELGILAELNLPSVKVRRRPIVAVMCTGDEIVEVGEEVPPGKVPNSLRHLVGAMIRQEGGEPLYLGIVGDDPSRLAEIVLNQAKRAEVIVTTGGTSVGKFDAVFRAVQAAGGDIIVHGVAAMPGRPALLARLPDGRPWVGLPGYPVAAAIDFALFVSPLIRTLLGLRWAPFTPKVRARLAAPVASSPGVAHFVRVKLKEEDGALFATPVRISGAGILSSLVKADGLVVVPEDIEGFPEGAEVEVELLSPYERWREWTPSLS
ncbi:MAG TPA: molybdopterin molybdenumtransferase MoeA [Candidatus Korarchaeota archaeon]|nr:molybdopterin molybdenumtransferase MoeA [Candidatus Korarchaeota archaeon]